MLVGVFVAAATSGVLLGFGLRTGQPLLRFNLTAAPLLDGPDQAGDFSPAVTLLGILVHVVWTLLAGVAFTLLGASGGTARRVVIALALAGVVLLLQRTLSPWIGGSSAEFPLALAHGVAFAIVLAAALVIGMRLAFERDEWS